jgi:hypothetical protein
MPTGLPEHLDPKKMRTEGGRDCGDCRMCCKVSGIREWGRHEDGRDYEWEKLEGQWCQYSTKKERCQVYQYGPPVRAIACASYTCAWRDGIGLDRHRPDRSRLVVTFEAHDKVGVYLVLRENIFGARSKGTGLEMFEFLRQCQTRPVLVIHPGNRGARELWFHGDKRKTTIEKQTGPRAEHDVHQWIAVPEGGRRCLCGLVELDRKFEGCVHRPYVGPRGNRRCSLCGQAMEEEEGPE